MNNLIPQPQAESDSQLIRLWLHGRSPATIRAYSKALERFRVWCPLPLPELRLADLQGYADSLTGGLATRNVALSAIKSLVAFGHRIGYLRFDVGGPLRLQSGKDRLTERILTQDQVHAMIREELNARNRAILLMLYGVGLRVSELTGLKWRDVSEAGAGETAILNVFGKGRKTRTILIPLEFWRAMALAGSREMNDPIFRSERGGHLDQSQICRIVRAAGHRAGIEMNVSPHWLRHAHATHAIENGAAIHLVQATLGHSSVATTSRYLHARPDQSSGEYLKP